MKEIVDNLARKLVIAEEKLLMKEHFPPLEYHPDTFTNRTDHLPYVLWMKDPHFTGDNFPWKCQGAFRCEHHAELIALEHNKRGLTVSMQSPDRIRVFIHCAEKDRPCT